MAGLMLGPGTAKAACLLSFQERSLTLQGTDLDEPSVPQSRAHFEKNVSLHQASGFKVEV